MAQPTLKITYFPFKGRAEYVRLACEVAGLTWEDNRITHPEFRELKEGGALPFGAMPVMEVDGTTFGQSNALLRYVGTISSPRLYPEDPLQALIVNEALDQIEEIAIRFGSTLGIDNEEEKIAARRQYEEKYVRPALAGLEARAQAVGTPGYYCGDSTTVADLRIYCMREPIASGLVEHVTSTMFSEYPAVNAICDRVAGEEAVRNFEERVAAAKRAAEEAKVAEDK